jgi:bifunctional non-homologous end joining protein LigD
LPLSRVAEPFDDPAFIYELKHDGFRALAYIDRGKPARLVSRRGNDYRNYAALAAELAKSVPPNTILDGELVVLDAEGRSQFEPLLRRRAQPVFCAFDILWSNGDDLRDMPLLARKSLLCGVVRKSDHVLVADHVVGRGVDLFRAVCERDCEGVVAKLAASPYRLLDGKRSPWIKVRNAGYTQMSGRFDYFQRRRG